MITLEIKKKLAKVYALVDRGGTEGEKAAAKAALDRLVEKYQLEGVDLDELTMNTYDLTFTSEIEVALLAQILKVLIDDQHAVKNAARGPRFIRVKLTYFDYVTASCAYEYFRKHMKGQWNKLCAKHVNRCRTAKTKNKKRSEMQHAFISRYIAESGLATNVVTRSILDLTDKELKMAMMLQDIEGGQYNRQMTSGLLLGE